MNVKCKAPIRAPRIRWDPVDRGDCRPDCTNLDAVGEVAAAGGLGHCAERVCAITARGARNPAVKHTL
jgi:hypothetical protein